MNTMAVIHRPAHVGNAENAYALLFGNTLSNSSTLERGIEHEWTSYCFATDRPGYNVDVIRWWQVRVSNCSYIYSFPYYLL
jgi:hypothetical protein